MRRSTTTPVTTLVALVFWLAATAALAPPIASAQSTPEPLPSVSDTYDSAPEFTQYPAV